MRYTVPVGAAQGLDAFRVQGGHDTGPGRRGWKATEGGSILHVYCTRHRDFKIISLSLGQMSAPPAGFEPALPPPEGGALSPELRGPGETIYQREPSSPHQRSILDAWPVVDDSGSTLPSACCSAAMPGSVDPHPHPCPARETRLPLDRRLAQFPAMTHMHVAGSIHADVAARAPGWLAVPGDVNALLPRLWSAGVSKDDDGVLTVAGVSVTEIADQVGTPAYVVDEADLRARARAFADAFAGWDVYYAGEVVPLLRGRPLGERRRPRHRRLQRR